MKKTIFLLCIVLLTSCRRTVMIMMGVHQPRIESDNSIVKFLGKANVSTDEIYHVDSVMSYNFWKDSAILGRIPDLKIYNSKGELLKRLEKNQCSGIYTDEIAQMDLPNAPAAINNGENVSSSFEMYRRMDGKKTHLGEFKPGEFIACIYYLDALGKVSRDNIEGWTSSLKKNKSADKIKILYMNMDMHTSWGITSRKDPRRLKFDY
jgi:hypothetical protein